MGIARRKAGTVVRCPTCSGQVVVPTPDPGAGASAAEEDSSGKGPALFERSDFEQDVFGGDAARSAARGGFAPVPPPAPLPPPPPPTGFDVSAAPLGAPSFAGPAQPPGLVLTPVKAIVLAVFVVVLLGIAFFAGMLVGRS
jgi:hypothetical protein